MKNITNAYTGLCPDCKYEEQTRTIYEDGQELRVCYHCGKIDFAKKFDSRGFIKDLIDNGITSENDLEEMLAEKLFEVYSWNDYCDTVTLARLLVKELYVELKFEAEAEAADAAEYNQEWHAARIGAY